MILHLTRESVCMGDDVMAPNAGTLDLPPDTLLPQVISALLADHYLASVSGGATWSVWSHQQLLATLHEPDTARPDCLAQTLLAPGTGSLQAKDLDPLSFGYHCAADPAEVLRNPGIRR